MVMGDMLKVLEGFHNRVVKKVAGKTARRRRSGEWQWPPVSEALDTAATVSAQVACWPIYDLCTGEERMPGTIRFMWWWDQDVGKEVE